MLVKMGILQLETQVEQEARQVTGSADFPVPLGKVAWESLIERVSPGAGIRARQMLGELQAGQEEPELEQLVEY